MNVPKVGDRVRVNVTDTSAWNADALAILQGLTGKVTEVLTHERMTNHPKTKPACLVEFDKPPAKLWKWGSPATSHWFDADELEALS